jgi:hypothetical protein
MTEVNDLKSVAEALNIESDALHETLDTINRKLNALNIGLEVWLNDYADVMAVDIDDCYHDEAAGVTYYVGWILGYCKFSDVGWSIAASQAHVRELEQGQEPDDFHNDELVTRLARTERGLLNGPRSVRIEAVAKLPKLIAKLKAEAEKAVETLRKAKCLADSL